MRPMPNGGRFRTAPPQLIFALTTAASAVAWALPALAVPETVTNINYYDVDATSAPALHQQMIARGPVHGRGRAYANIVAKPDYSGQLVQGQSCRLEDFTVSAEFTMTLPRLGGGAKLSPDLAARWSSFEDFVRRHEEGHRAIWLETMDRARTRISALSAPTCRELQAEVDVEFQKEWRSGERRQDAYDRADQEKLVRHPLLQAAASARRKVASALARQPVPEAPAMRRVGGRAM